MPTATGRATRTRASLAAAAALAACAAAVFLLRAPPDLPAAAQVAEEPAAPAAEPAAKALPPPPPEAEPPAAAAADPDGPPAPCDGCLDAAAALDLAETLVAASGGMRRVGGGHGSYLGVRVDRAHDLEWWTKKRRYRAVPTEGLLDAPEYLTFSGPKLPGPPCRGYDDPKCRGPREEWWIVWLHVGWHYPHEWEDAIENGRLPETARAWPPIKREDYIIVDARTGRIVANSGGDWIPWYAGPGQTFLPQITESAYQAVEERARHYLGNRARGPIDAVAEFLGTNTEEP